ncbi:hypothetical protein SCB49_05687 [unidentified eubacterium SCB49]|nr:hypothetical protein SCB49_05687 [unidentified eubacterium SCB49]
MNRTHYFIILVFSFLLTACGGGKPVTGSSKADKSLAVKAIVASHNNAAPNFNTLAGRMYVAYEDDKKSQGITVSLRMQKDEKIWIKASLLGVTVAKALITKESVQYYETIGKTYFDGDFTLLSKWLGTDIDYKKAQAILLGQSVFDLNANNYNSVIVTNKYRLQPKTDIGDFFFSVLLNPDTFKVSRESVSQPSEKRQLDVQYGEYQLVDKQLFPTTIEVNTDEEGSKTKIEVEYRKIDLNPSINFSFNIPNGYSQIEL